MFVRRQTPPDGDLRVLDVRRAEAALIEHYARLVGRAACRLNGLRGQGVRAVNHWVFAQQDLPERAGQGAWVCARADTWRGPGRVEYLFLGPGTEPARSAGVREDTGECSRFGQDVLADVDWRAPSGSSYPLAAGSRSVGRVEASGPLRAEASGGDGGRGQRGRQGVMCSLPFSSYSAPGGLPQGPGRGAESPAEAGKHRTGFGGSTFSGWGFR